MYIREDKSGEASVGVRRRRRRRRVGDIGKNEIGKGKAVISNALNEACTNMLGRKKVRHKDRLKRNKKGRRGQKSRERLEEGDRFRRG